MSRKKSGPEPMFGSGVYHFSRTGANPRERWTSPRPRGFESPMPPKRVHPLRLFLKPPHPVRDNQDSYELLNRHAAIPRQILESQKDTTIQNLHKLHRFLRITHRESLSHTGVHCDYTWVAYSSYGIESKSPSTEKSHQSLDRARIR